MKGFLDFFKFCAIFRDKNNENPQTSGRNRNFAFNLKYSVYRQFG